MEDEVEDEKEPAAGAEVGRRDVKVPGVVFRLRMGMRLPAAASDDPLPDDDGPHEGAPR